MEEALVTIYSFFTVEGGSAEPEFETRSFLADAPAVEHGKALLRQRSRIRIAEVWDDPLRLAHYDRTDFPQEASARGG